VCGILGLAAAGPVDPARVDAVELMHHRGPDGEGRYASGPIALAARRLAIIDLETGDQPLANEAGDVVCVLNGEIYNYRELRSELTAAGHVFRSQGDVEVVPHLYEEHGDAFLERLRGMFALALWDERRGRLLVARDRFGIKPLYLAEVDGALAFASEIRPLLALGAGTEPDPQAIADYFAFGYVPGEATGLATVRRLLPGHALVWEDGRTRRLEWWRPEPSRDLTELDGTLREAVRLHLRSDVPLAVLLSGGLDSSLVAALAASELDEPLNTFSVGFADPELDERSHARAVAEAIGSNHEEVVVEARVAADLPEVAARLEQPLADPAAIPLWYLSRAVAGAVKVALAGDGGDEAFGGYSRYAWDPKAARLARVLPSRALARALARLPERSGRKNVSRRVLKLLRHADLPEAKRYFAWFSILSDETRLALEPPERIFERLFDEAPQSLSRLGRLQYVDLRSMLTDNLLLKADKLSMAHSLELRVPLLDHRVVEAGLGLPDRDKVRGVRTKAAIRRLVAERLPKAISRRPKQGFDAPVDRWLRGELRDLAGDAIGDLDGLLDARACRRLLDRHLAGEVDAGQQLYALLMLSLWRAALPGRRPEPSAVRV
jgi:asparagine synthase (glutamine-hydrolysing)